MSTSEAVRSRRCGVKSRLIGELGKFYRDPQNVEIYEQYLKQRLGRTFEWLCTHENKHPDLPPLPQSMTLEDIHYKYKQQLGYLHKRFFDPTNRNHGDDTRITIQRRKADTEKQIKATIGCLQFIRWAQHLELVDYCIRNKDKLTKIRREQAGLGEAGTGHKRKYLSQPLGMGSLVPGGLFARKVPRTHAAGGRIDNFFVLARTQLSDVGEGV